MAAKPGSAALEVQHQDGCLVTSGGTVVLEQLAGEVRVRQLGAAAVIGLEHPSGQPVAAADFSVGKVGAGCVAIAACNCASTSAIKHTQHPVPRVLLAIPSTVLPPRRRRRRCPAPTRRHCTLAPPAPPCPQLRASRFLALGRTSLWWMTPAWGCSTQHIPEETQCLLLELEAGGGYALILPLIDSGTFRATLRPAR